MAGLGEYGDEGFSSYHAKKNPFLITQSLSANPIEMGSPAKLAWFIPMIAGALKTATGAVAAGALKVGALAAKGGAAIAKGVGAKALSAKLATKGATLGAKAATKWGATKAASKGILKPVLGAKGKTGAVETVSKNFGKEALSSAKKGDVLSTIENVKSTKGFQGVSSAKSSLDKTDAEGEAHASAGYDRASRFTSNTPKIGGGTSSIPEEDLSSVLTYKKPVPFKMKGWSPFRSKGKSAAYSAATSSGYSGQVGAIRDSLKNIKFGSKTELGA